MSAAAVLPSLVDTIEEIRQSCGGPVAIDDVAGIVTSLMTSIQGDLSSSDLQAYQYREYKNYYRRHTCANMRRGMIKYFISIA